MNENDTDFLIQYLDGELSENDKAAMKSRIENDASLQQAIENLQGTQLAIKHYGLQQHVANIHAEMMKELKETASKKTRVIPMFAKVFRVAAVFIVVIGCLAIYQYTSLSSEKLFNSNYQAYSLHESRGDNSSSTLEQLFKRHLTQQLISSFSTVRQPTVTDYFYLANAYLERHNAPAAIQALHSVQQKNAKQNSHLLEDDVEYYLAMAYLQNNEPSKALPLLSNIHNDEQHLYHDKVSSLFLLKVKLLTKK
ncbi:MAG: hypothetical protein M3040_01475 [Bacteroidota bacterium]|nr:hypothetical protein [Bacteroidota bacterium]